MHSTMGWRLPYYYPVQSYLNRIAISTLKVDGWQLSMTSKKSNWLWGKQVIDEGADPAGELSTTLLWTAFTLHAFIWSLGRKFTGFWIRRSLEVITRTRSQVTNFLKNLLEKIVNNRLTKREISKVEKIESENLKVARHLAKTTVFVSFHVVLVVFIYLSELTSKHMLRQPCWQKFPINRNFCKQVDSRNSSMENIIITNHLNDWSGQEGRRASDF